MNMNIIESHENLFDWINVSLVAQIFMQIRIHFIRQFGLTIFIGTTQIQV